MRLFESLRNFAIEFDAIMDHARTGRPDPRYRDNGAPAAPFPQTAAGSAMRRR
ncbi:hypothetical protein [Mesorhizobium xinjiangense]|uniref:hypothetical protein n=1 Tax=Mesorhizobium xinjiangense TaxID=2678685 RepID=UPI0012ED4FC3|nr:hypothetical protein [Mesorhizobium xinjiangense]